MLPLKEVGESLLSHARDYVHSSFKLDYRCYYFSTISSPLNPAYEYAWMQVEGGKYRMKSP